MKKILSFIFVLFSVVVMADSRITWEYVGSLPAQKGFEKNIGTAGLLYGQIGEYFVVGGGANFPDKPLTDGGKKVTHKDLYLLKEINNELKVVDQMQFDYEIGYGASVSIDDSIYYLGGSADINNARNILKVAVENEKIKVEKVGELAVGFENGVAAYRDGKIYYGVGKLEDVDKKLKNGNDFYYYDLKTKENKKLAQFPSEKRSQTVGKILNDKFYVFSGGSSVSYVDGYAYDFNKDTWEKVADVIVNGEKILLLGANSVKLSENEMLVIGGFNYNLWNEANDKLSNLKDEELTKYKEQYFGKEPFRYEWNKKVLVYNAKDNTWKSIGEVPFDAPCGAALLLKDKFIYNINGEIKPGVRTPRMFRGRIY